MMKRGAGFTLVELLVAIAIAGLLASIAVPSYHRILERVKISQGKSVLADIYLAEMLYKTENMTYASRLDAVGVALEGRVYFDAGFENDLPPPAGKAQGTSACNTICKPGCRLNRRTGGAKCLAEALNGLDGNVHAHVTTNAFLAVAHSHFGVVYSGDTMDPYTFTIDDKKNLKESIPAN